MYKTKIDFAKKKKKEALRTLVQSGRYATSAESSVTEMNPFLVSLEGKSRSECNNPFLIQLGKQYQTESSIQLPFSDSRAGAVQGLKAQNPRRIIPPSFITQGPASVQIGSARLNEKKELQHFLSHTQDVDKAQNSRLVQSLLLEKHTLTDVQSEVQTYNELTSASPQIPPANDPNCTSIHVKGIPDNLNNQKLLTEHFSQFGQVQSVFCNRAKLYATVTFKHKNGAVQAKKHGRKLPDGTTVKLFWNAFTGSAGKSAVSSTFVSSLNLVLSTQNQPTAVNVNTRKQPQKNVDKEYLPSDDADEGNDSDEIDFDDEGVDEGKDSVILSHKTDAETMDTIAKCVTHNYYLRSLDKPDSGTTIAPQVSLLQNKLVQNVQMVQDNQMYLIPNPNLPVIPMSKGSTVAELCEALEHRDQEIRKSLKKQKTLNNATAAIGTCPDMCPEKERYQREERRALHIFEILADSDPAQPKVNHQTAVKEYSGSAADKEEPLPHELRPTGVLRMTMDYLATFIMDCGEKKRAEWYDFLWNRTRAIRKDITLQHLCSTDCICLVEQCARFHILCAHLMCEEDLKAFDPKMNDENLNKCLQTLRQYYADLQLKENEKKGRNLPLLVAKQETTIKCTGCISE